MVVKRATPAKKAPARKVAAKKAAPARKAPAKPAGKKTADGTHSHTQSTAPKLQAEEPQYREPIRPTASNITEVKSAVVMLIWDITKPNPGDYGAPTDRDMDGTDDVAMAREGFEGHLSWAAEDLEEYGDFWHAVILIEDTSTLEFNRVEVRAGDKKWADGLKAYLEEFPQTIFSRTKREAIKKAKEPTIKKIAKKAPNAAPKSVGKAPTGRTSKNAFVKLAAEMTDEELADLSLEQVEQLPKNLKGKAMALRSKKQREERSAKAQSAKPSKPAPSAPKAIGNKRPVKRPRPKATAAA